MTINSMDERLLLQQIAEGSEKAFAVLVEQKWNNIYWQAITYVKSSSQAQDIVQDVFLKVWQKRKDLPQVERFDSYLFIMARNHIISALRKKTVLPLSDDALEVEEKNYLPDRALAQKTLAELIARAVELLPQQQRTAYLLSRDQGLSHEEIASNMQVSKEAVKKHICRALNFLRRYISVHSEITTVLSILYIITSGRL
ncbi:MAG TPA: RNA polymerase sigma-70 factor [Chitinophaga sp.]|nr:RNA polymerase sigma-70 factor [Chitinophaga sp.]